MDTDEYFARVSGQVTRERCQLRLTDSHDEQSFRGAENASWLHGFNRDDASDREIRRAAEHFLNWASLHDESSVDDYKVVTEREGFKAVVGHK
jgi:hypothetical protein